MRTDDWTRARPVERERGNNDNQGKKKREENVESSQVKRTGS
jgi:hypothetical protein